MQTLACCLWVSRQSYHQKIFSWQCSKTLQWVLCSIQFKPVPLREISHIYRKFSIFRYVSSLCNLQTLLCEMNSLWRGWYNNDNNVSKMAQIKKWSLRPHISPFKCIICFCIKLYYSHYHEIAKLVTAPIMPAWRSDALIINSSQSNNFQRFMALLLSIISCAHTVQWICPVVKG